MNEYGELVEWYWWLKSKVLGANPVLGATFFPPKIPTRAGLGLPTNRPSNGVALFGVDSSWNVTAHGDAREGKWRGNWTMQWVASTLHTTSEHGVSSITTADAHTSAASSRLNWRSPADLNGLVRFAERRNLVSARVPSHFNWPSYLLTSRFAERRNLVSARVPSHFNWPSYLLTARFAERRNLVCVCVPSHFNWPSYLLTTRFAERRNLVCVRVPSHFNWPSYLLTAWVCSHNFMSYPANKAAVICAHALQYLCVHYCCQHHCLWLGYLLAILPCALYRQQQSCVYTEWR